jgi:hypothetical protein
MRMEPTDRISNLRLEDFLPLVGDLVELDAGGRHGTVEIKEAALLPSPSPRSQPPFHVMLRSPPEWNAGQGIFRLHHPQLGALDVFAVPTGPDGSGFCYQIIFN